MKKLILTILFLMLTGQALAAGYGTAGCGLGSMIFHDQEGMVQIFAATTNGTSANQTFGITSGTSNCQEGGASASLFIEANKVALANDIARGQGETLNSLGSLYGCSNDIGPVLQENYNTVFKNNDAIQINETIQKIIVSNNACNS